VKRGSVKVALMAPAAFSNPEMSLKSGFDSNAE